MFKPPSKHEMSPNGIDTPGQEASLVPSRNRSRQLQKLTCQDHRDCTRIHRRVQSRWSMSRWGRETQCRRLSLLYRSIQRGKSMLLPLLPGSSNQEDKLRMRLQRCRPDKCQRCNPGDRWTQLDSSGLSGKCFRSNHRSMPSDHIRDREAAEEQRKGGKIEG